jgi:prepilin-type N-terminal cleavage/methylation domain-containing protein/prepilin-type processing-associated H-X9-DG protein
MECQRVFAVQDSSRKASRCLAFTLIELLVVIAIIAILAAILFPVFTKAKENARTMRCVNNCKQMMTAIQSYTQDYNFRLPNGTFVAYNSLKPRYLPYVKNSDVTHCTEFVWINDWATGQRLCENFAYAYNHTTCGPLKYHNRAMPSNIASRCDIWSNAATSDPSEWCGRMFSDVHQPSRMPAMFCSRPMYRSPQGFFYSYQWEPNDIGNPDRMRNPHSDGTVYGFLDGHVKWLLPAGNGFYMATDGIDYDGNGTVGSANFMR